MECPIKTPVRVIETNGTIVDASDEIVLKVLVKVGKFNLQSNQLNYTAEAINSHEKFNNAVEIQTIISRLERNRNAERLNSKATLEPAKSFWRGQADKASEVIFWLEQALKAEKS